MNLPITSVFDLPERLAAKADPALIAADDEHFTTIAGSLERSIADLTASLDAERRAPAGRGRQAVDRDDAVRRLSSRLRALRRYSLDLCLGRMVYTDGRTVYVGRLGLTGNGVTGGGVTGGGVTGDGVTGDGVTGDGVTGHEGDRLLVDWRSPAAEPFFGATHANPMGLVSRRRYRWADGRVTDYWDEVFSEAGIEARGKAALDDQSAFIASLGSSRSPRMRDVLGTIQADQDAIIRAGSAGVLVVDGGPGTGKTVVALHRTAYLRYSDPRLGRGRGGVLFVGPHEPYLAYVADVLPNLGEDDVQTCTVRDLVPEGAAAAHETDPEVARLKSSAELVRAMETAVRFYEEPPANGMTIDTDEGDVRVTARDWAAAFEAPDPGTPHNEARDQIWEELLAILAERSGVSESELGRSSELRTALNRSWPLLEAADLVADLWSVPAYLRRCAPWLSIDDIRRLQRPYPRAWTVSDLPLLDALRQRLGDSSASERRRRERAAVVAGRREMDRVVDDLIASNEYDDGEGLMTMLRQQDLREVLAEGSALASADPDLLAGPFAHVVVDEAQELTDAEWQMLLSRCPSRSLTVVGDRAQARHGFSESWQERLERVGLDRITLSRLTVNYRTPEEVMAAAEPVIRAALPDANVPVSIRSSGIPVHHGSVAELDTILESWLATHAEGTACVISDGSVPVPARDRVRSLTPSLAKGLEFDLVALIDPDSFGDGVEGAVDRYVAMTRATSRLVVLSSATQS
ncbi:DNA helicase [Actinoplanes italicus]|uniref:DNA helicase IV n=1 Tax=Actinoplanes italicus TaxID=113567 RepID=A0A2T0K7Y6_9ACTN|nr:RNA polymerase recycling motor ATPase HelR [Actinoplanes italicus]PRX18951.1 DNA helicase IV [Actinoplanes italicus]GIE32469.1 DNA helicase [Actinoplanes italicus]